jgi:hypothetical protein
VVPADSAFMVCAAIGEPLHRATALGYYTVQRKQDCLSVTKAARSGGEIEFQPMKISDPPPASRNAIEFHYQIVSKFGFEPPTKRL